LGTADTRGQKAWFAEFAWQVGGVVGASSVPRRWKIQHL
jgi:hypothetical protein